MFGGENMRKRKFTFKNRTNYIELGGVSSLKSQLGGVFTPPSRGWCKHITSLQLCIFC